MVKTVSQQNLPKTIFFVLKALSFAATRSSKLVIPYSDYLLYTVIPQHVKLVPTDEALANDDPL